MPDYSEFVPQVHFELIPINNLVSNQDYQRALSRMHIAKTAANFDIFQVNPVKVSRRDGINYVFNGQHTIEIIAYKSGSRDTPVWCMIYEDLSYEHEAHIFANQQKYVKSLQAYEVFFANVEAGNDDQLIIRDLLASYNLVVGCNRAPGVINAISTVEKIYFQHGFHVLDKTIRLIAGTWEGEVNSFSGNILNAVSRIILAYGKQLDEVEFKEKVGAIPLKQLARQAKERRAGSLGFSEAMVIIYNGRKKGGRLSITKLYSPDKFLFENFDHEDTQLNIDEQDIEVDSEVVAEPESPAEEEHDNYEVEEQETSEPNTDFIGSYSLRENWG